MSSLAENLEKKLQSYLEGGLTEAVLKAEADTNKRLDDSIQKVLGGLKIEIHPCPHVFKDGRKCGHYGFEKFKVLNPETGEWEWYCKSTHKSMAVEKYKVSQKFSDELAAQKKENEILKNQLRQKRDREDELAKKKENSRNITILHPMLRLKLVVRLLLRIQLSQLLLKLSPQVFQLNRHLRKPLKALKIPKDLMLVVLQCLDSLELRISKGCSRRNRSRLKHYSFLKSNQRRSCK